MAIQHIAIIPDGNRRWARERNLPSVEGHRVAAEKILPSLLQKACDLGIPYFTFWVLSTENTVKRSPTEVNNLFRLMRLFIQVKLNELHRKGVKLRVMGDISALPPDIQKGIQDGMKKTSGNTSITLILAINYGGRNEIVRAVKSLITDGVTAEDLTDSEISDRLDSHDIPDPDLIIRSGGEKRTSGFMLWQSEYTEYAFIDEYFPAVSDELFQQCIDDFETRQRRFGK